MEKEKDVVSKSENNCKKWIQPKLTVFGDMRVITQGSQVYGSGDVGYEHQKPSSVGNP